MEPTDPRKKTYVFMLTRETKRKLKYLAACTANGSMSAWLESAIIKAYSEDRDYLISHGLNEHDEKEAKVMRTTIPVKL